MREQRLHIAACALTFALGRGGTVALVLAGAAVSSLMAAGIALAIITAVNLVGTNLTAKFNSIASKLT